MAPMKNKDTNKPGKKPSAPRQIDPSPINKENLRSFPKSARKSAAAIASSEAVGNDPLTQPSPTSPAVNDEVSDVEEEFDVDIKWSCNQIRTKITTYLNNTGMTLKDFQSKINVSPNSYRTFMQQSGPHAGAGNNTYMHAHRFFDKREAAGLKMPRASKSKNNPPKEEADKFDVSGITLDGEAEGNVPVYDTCNDVRRKIETHLRKNNVTQAAFARAISACQGENGTPIQGKQITDFTRKGKRGPMSGNTSKAFYCAYVYFEKLRVKDGKKKSKKREEMEKEYAPSGVDRLRVSENVGVWCHTSERPVVDNLGRLDIQPIMRRI